MKRPAISSAPSEPTIDTLLKKILRRCGAYYHSAGLFYQEMWKQRLVSIGFRVLLIEKLSLHHVWDIRLCGRLTAQTHLLLSKPVPQKYLDAKDIFLKQLRSEIRRIAQELGLAISPDCLTVVRTGNAYFQASFIWPMGKPGRLLKKEKPVHAFSFLIRPWLRRNRNRRMLPSLLKPMSAASAHAPFDSEQHVFEIKWDGIRCLAFIGGGRVRLQSRQLTEITAQFPELGHLRQLPRGTILDGELVVFQEGSPSLRQVQHRAFLQNRARIERLSQLTLASFMVFDLLYLEGRPLLGSPLGYRRDALVRLIQQSAPPGVLVSEAVAEHGCKLFAQVARLGLEGVMAKHVDSPYLPGKRSRHWLKIKPRVSAEVLMATTAMANSL